MLGLTKENFRHIGLLLRRGRNPVPVIYDSLGEAFPLALAPGWLNLGLWIGDGDAAEAPAAARRLVETLADDLPRHGVVLDVGNGLGAQDPVIAAVANPKQLIAVNITESQLRAGRSSLDEAGASPLMADATTLPIKDNSVDGVISVEAAFHFPSRGSFFAECARVLRGGGVLSMSDVSFERMPDSPATAWWGLAGLRVWGLSRRAMVPADEIARIAQDAGLEGVRTRRVGDRVIDPAFRYFSQRLDKDQVDERWLRWAGRALVRGWSQLRRRNMVDYVLLTARAP